VFALMSTSCGSDSNTTPNTSTSDHDAGEEHVTLDEDTVDDLSSSNVATPDSFDFDSLERTIREVLGSETAISRSNLTLESQETNLRISGEERLGTECVSATEEYIEFASEGADHLTAIVDEESSITPGSPPEL